MYCIKNILENSQAREIINITLYQARETRGPRPRLAQQQLFCAPPSPWHFTYVISN